MKAYQRIYQGIVEAISGLVERWRDGVLLYMELAARLLPVVIWETILLVVWLAPQSAVGRYLVYAVVVRGLWMAVCKFCTREDE